MLNPFWANSKKQSKNVGRKGTALVIAQLNENLSLKAKLPIIILSLIWPVAFISAQPPGSLERDSLPPTYQPPSAQPLPAVAPENQ